MPASNSEARKRHEHNAQRPVVASPQPDTAPEGPCSVDEAYGQLRAVLNLFDHMPDSTGVGDHRLTLGALRVIARDAAALNGAHATPAERAVIDAARWLLDASPIEGNPDGLARALDVLEDATAEVAEAVAYLEAAWAQVRKLTEPDV